MGAKNFAHEEIANRQPRVDRRGCQRFFAEAIFNEARRKATTPKAKPTRLGDLLAQHLFSEP
jgi:hypothetical protein